MVFQKKILSIVIILSGLFYFSCKNPSEVQQGPETPPPENPEVLDIRAPGDVKVYPRHDGFDIVWESVPEADYYDIYRQIEGGPIVIIKDKCKNTNYIDRIDTKKLVRYYVKSRKKGDSSDYSDPTDYVSIYVLNVKAGRFEETHKIVLTWEAHQSAESYNVYRYLYKSDEAPLCFEGIIETTFEDLYEDGNPESIEHGIPYYYKVTFIDKNKNEQGQEGSFTMGVFGAGKDFYEPNDDYTLLGEAEASSIFSQSQPPVIYSFGDEAGGVDSDTDWYLYYGLPENFFVKLRFPEDTPFRDGELRFQFYYPGAEQFFPEQPIYTRGTTTQNFNSFGSVPADEPVRVYFKIYPVIPGGKDVAGSYFVEITDEL